jgi:hypothetical protein
VPFNRYIHNIFSFTRTLCLRYRIVILYLLVAFVEFINPHDISLSTPTASASASASHAGPREGSLNDARTLVELNWDGSSGGTYMWHMIERDVVARYVCACLRRTHVNSRLL